MAINDTVYITVESYTDQVVFDSCYNGSWGPIAYLSVFHNNLLYSKLWFDFLPYTFSSPASAQSSLSNFTITVGYLWYNTQATDYTLKIYSKFS